MKVSASSPATSALLNSTHAAAKRIFILDDIVDSVLVSLSDGNYVCESRDGKEVISTTFGFYAYSIEMNEKTGDIISAAAESGTEKYEYLFLQ